MPTLADLIGQLLAGVTRARLLADLETIRVAELYSSHPYLKHFAIPRFRLPNVEITVPLVIREVEESEPSAPPSGLVASEVKAAALRAVYAQLEKHKITLTQEDKKKLDAGLEANIARIIRPEETAIDVTHLSRELVDGLLSVLKSLKAAKDVQFENWRPELYYSTKIHLINIRKSPPQIKILAETAKVKEAAPKEILTVLKFTMGEDAMEWTVIEKDGEEEDRLIPE
jgi:hypothetical protein